MPDEPGVGELVQAALDAKTKPRGSLGRLEELAVRVASIRGTTTPAPLRSAIVLAAADHGVAARGVSAYPQEVTGQMLATFAAGGAAVCVLAALAGAELRVFDLGVRSAFRDRSVGDLRIGPGTADLAEGPAMTIEQAEAAIAAGRRVAAGLESEGFGLVGLGEMGIGNTTAASALVAALLGVDPEETCGPGTGLDEAGVRRKVEVVGRALEVNRPDRDDPLATLAALGGFEIAFLAGVAVAAAERRLVVLLDGFITGAAALVAERLAPGTRTAMVAAHVSPEPGHRLVLDDLGLRPLLDLGLRLGEGSGAALALPLITASLAILDRMATFESAGVTDAGR
ncbi:MAG TPA: nicotinate-nucleotide--dimethylbenzimidazole phosphoribosyltransferase [Gaiellaceae bacterium]|nr:nicotinate-nucleotide--dimethylbenzimidazole phosphoribosyltransferase [Gaiellaceae bacterium]